MTLFPKLNSKLNQAMNATGLIGPARCETLYADALSPRR